MPNNEFKQKNLENEKIVSLPVNFVTKIFPFLDSFHSRSYLHY